jgi:hypothetical protein
MRAAAAASDVANGAARCGRGGFTRRWLVVRRAAVRDGDGGRRTRARACGAFDVTATRTAAGGAAAVAGGR